MIIRTWVNGWASSYRYHEDILWPCVFGCTHPEVKFNRDDLSHYLQCPHLHALQKFMHPDESSNPLIRVGLINPSINSLKRVACSSAGYHAVRSFFKSKNLPASNDSKFTPAEVRLGWGVFADAFSVAARELGIDVPRFSLPLFF